mgnify:CR=1 FL=1
MIPFLFFFPKINLEKNFFYKQKNLEIFFSLFSRGGQLSRGAIIRQLRVPFLTKNSETILQMAILREKQKNLWKNVFGGGWGGHELATSWTPYNPFGSRGSPKSRCLGPFLNKTMFFRGPKTQGVDRPAASGGPGF